MRVSLIALAGALVLGGCEAASEGEAAEVAQTGDAYPPLGRYVCRQYMTTIGWIDLSEDRYSVNDAAGTYDYDPASGAIEWQGGAYAGWPARYEFSPAGEGHAHDEYIIRMTDETDSLRIDCFLTRD